MAIEHVLYENHQAVRGAELGAAPRFRRGSGGRSPPVLQAVRGAQPPATQGGLGGALGPPTLHNRKLIIFLPEISNSYFNILKNNSKNKLNK